MCRKDVSFQDVLKNQLVCRPCRIPTNKPKKWKETMLEVLNVDPSIISNKLNEGIL